MAKQFILDRSQLVPVMEAVPTEKIPIYSSETAAIAALSNHNVGDILATRDATEADILSNLITKVAELEAGNVYSTSEVNTGKTWIDGKPIYRKVYVKTTHIGDYALIDIISMVNEGHEQGVLLASEAEMIQNIFEFGEKEAKDIMTHRKNIIAIDGESTFSEVLTFVTENNYSRYPVYLDDMDNIITIGFPPI